MPAPTAPNKQPNPKFCAYCKKPNHTKEECFKLKRKREAEQSAAQATAVAAPTKSSVHVIADPIAIPTEEAQGIFPFTIEGIRPARCLMDSGSKISVASDDFVTQTGCPVDPTAESYTAANNEPLDVAGAVTLTFAANGLRIRQRFIVVTDFAFPVLLGRDFLRASKANFSFGNGVVTLGSGPDTVKIQAAGAKDGVDGVDLFGSGERVCAITLATPNHAVLMPEVQPEVRPEKVPPPEHVDLPPRGEQIDVATVISSSPNLADDAPPTYTISADLSDAQTQSIAQLLEQYDDLFARHDGDVGQTAACTHVIDTGNHRPVNQPPRRLAPPLMDEAERQIESMLNSGVIRESSSPWASPILFTDKKDLTKRFCVDFRLLNALTTKDRYPLPRIDDSLDLLGGNRYFTSLDLKSGYWQKRVDINDVPKTAFICPFGLYEFLVMPFGLCNAPRTFQRAMDTVLAGLKWRTCLIYIDDILVFSASFDAHLKHLDAVLRRLRRHNLKIPVSPKKCLFAFSELKYLGYIISPDGLLVDPKKIDSVQKVAIPTTKGDIRSFVGLTSYYRRFIYKFAQLIEPLTRLLRDVPFIWGADQQDAFERLKKRLTSAPLLIYPDWDKMFFLQTDASDYAIAAVLTQLDDDGYERVVSYASRQLRDPERRYDTREKELLAVVYGCREFRKYLWGPPFVVQTDHANMRWLMPTSDLPNRLARWALLLQEFDFTIEHRPGRANQNADALSRLPIVAAIDKDRALLKIPSLDEMLDHQRRDPLLASVCQFLEQPTAPDAIPPEVKETLADSGKLFVDLTTGLLMHEATINGNVVRVPYPAPRDRYALLQAMHSIPSAGHLGRRKTQSRIRQRYY